MNSRIAILISGITNFQFVPLDKYPRPRHPSFGFVGLAASLTVGGRRRIDVAGRLIFAGGAAVSPTYRVVSVRPAVAAGVANGFQPSRSVVVAGGALFIWFVVFFVRSSPFSLPAAWVAAAWVAAAGIVAARIAAAQSRLCQLLGQCKHTLRQALDLDEELRDLAVLGVDLVLHPLLDGEHLVGAARELLPPFEVGLALARQAGDVAAHLVARLLVQLVG